jgi:hypothetical protein
MGYFEGLSSSSFKKDADGRTVFYPIGILGRGRLLPDLATEERIRAFLIRYYMVSLSLIIVVVASVHWGWGAALIPVLWLWFHLGTKLLVAGLPSSTSRLTLKESYANSANAHGKGMLWSLLVCSGLRARWRPHPCSIPGHSRCIDRSQLHCILRRLRLRLRLHAVDATGLTAPWRIVRVGRRRVPCPVMSKNARPREGPALQEDSCSTT